MIQHAGLTRIARIAIAFLLLFAIAGASVWSLSSHQSVALADDSDDWDDDSDDDDGYDDDRDRDRSGKGRGSNSESGNSGKGGGGTNSGRGNHDDDEDAGDDDDDREQSLSGDEVWSEDEPIVAIPSVTSVPGTNPDEAGALRIEAFRCTERPTDGDWEKACLDVDDLGKFELEADDGPNRGWFRKIEADATGVLIVEPLPAGRYELDRINGDWCHAEATRVDTGGDLIILPGEITTVWVYTCDIFAK